ncbi:MAG: undecaprenyl/decaprenyl-phosphate alpha-N-acetylglucosaminyl 1-phosphate transferase, partial [Deltaproteobacteria bacterium]|nr:undecaprenyl/decaprenyl-phosphate alpha-N-acetylglucosaminyl 1-phosphate transferase [Deltaproteobacteria bacterium]
MKTLIVTFVVSAFVAVVVTPLVRRFAPAIGSVDLPSGRRVNKKVIPRLGGVAILLGFLAPLLGLFIYSNRISIIFQSDMHRVISLFLGSIVIAATGALDDIRGSRAIVKLVVQILVAVGAYLGGYQINTITLPFTGSLEMGIFAMPITTLWIVGIVNAVNLIDGLDGLAAGVAFFVCVVNFTIGIISNNILLALFAVALGGALIG